MGHTINSINQTFVNNSDANFRIWGKWLSDQLTSAGIIKTSDTGQINWATVTTPAAISTSQGYEIRRFDDTLQSTVPIFFKIEYGSGGTSALRPALWITIGTGSDGAGNITGSLFARLTIPTGGVLTNADYKHVFSGSTNRFFTVMGYQTVLGGAANAQYWSIGMERTKDSAGADDSTGILLTLVGPTATNVIRIQVLPFSGAIPTAEVAGTMLIPAATSTISGSTTGIFPANYFYFGYSVNPGLNYFGYRSDDITKEVPISVDVYGVSHTYFPIGIDIPGLSQQFFAITRNNNTIMIRYE